MATAGGAGGSSLHRSATNVYRRLLNFDSPLAAIGLDNVVPKGEEKLLKSSFYQAATMFVLAFGLAGVYSLYVILAPFVKPILWAVLVGTVLHPLKLAVTHSVRTWLCSIGNQSSVPILSFHVAISPFTIICSAFLYVQRTVMKFIIPLAAASALILLLCAMVRFNFPLISNFVAIQSSVLEIAAHFWDIVTLPWPFYLTSALGYAIAVIVLPPHYWHPIVLKICPVVWWIFLSFLCSKMLGPLSMMVFPALLIPLVVKLISVYLKVPSKEKAAKQAERFVRQDRPSLRSLKRASEFLAVLSPRLANIDLQAALSRGIDSPPTKSNPERKPNSSKPANIMILVVIWAVVLVKLLCHPFLIGFLVPFFLLPPLFRYCAQSERISRFIDYTLKFLYSWFESRKSGFISPPVAKVGRYLVKGDAKIRKLLESGVESCVTILLILGVVLVFGLMIFISAVQLHRETVYVFTMTNELLNRTLHPEVNRWLESADMNVTSLHEIASNAADFGRQFFNTTIDSWVRSVPDAQRDQLKLQLMNAYDLMSTKFVKSWQRDLDHTLNSRSLSTSSLMLEDDDKLELSSMYSSWFYFLRQNIDSVLEIGQSVWAVLKENAGLLLAIFGHISSALLLCSWALFGYAVSTVVFLTTLFYLLTASGQTYKPVQILISLTPFDDDRNESNIVGRAVDSGIRGVFYATFKMIIFYGLYTWFLHSVFEIGIAFLPSICAAVFAAVPIVGAYWASLPGVFQLWLVADRGLAALLFFGLHMLPMYFVDALIYADIKGGGHPYLTGLAIVGGVSCLGFEGAILGPVLLCLIVILMNLYRGILHNSDQSNSKAEEVASQTSVTPAVQTLRRMHAKTLTASTAELVSSTSSIASATCGLIQPAVSTTSLPDEELSKKEE